MVFSSIPSTYLDPPNWHQPPNHQQQQHQFGGMSSGGGSTQLLSPPAAPPPYSGGGGGAGSIRPGSMTDRARMANIPMPEAALKCPRCDSTNTKFCYFNNYSLSQPRHFCKTCRRYWTRGGTLRSVPVGGGCRRNKRSSKPGSSKSPAASGDRQTCSSSSAASVTSSGAADPVMGSLGPPLRYMMAPLHNFTDLSARDFELTYVDGLSNNDLSFHSLGVSSVATGTPQQWRQQQQTLSQFPFLGAGFDPPPLAAELLYPYGHQSSTFFGQHQNQVRPKAPATSGVVKMEDDQNHKHHQNQDNQLSFSRQLLGNITGNEQFWGGVGANAWNDLSGFTSSSTSHP